MKPGFLTIFFLSVMTLKTVGQEMNLNQCIRYALENNLTYANKNIEADIADEQYRQSKRDFLPSFYAGSSANKLYGRSIDPTTNAFINQDFFSMNFYLDSQLDLFRGFTRLNSAKFQKLHYLINKEAIKQQEMNIAFKVMNMYYDVLYFNKLLGIVGEQVELSALNLQKTEKMIALGLKAESDLLEMKAQESKELHNLTLVQNQYEQALLSLKNLMYYPLDKELNIETDELPLSSDVSFSPDEVYKVAEGHMPDVQRANLNAEASRKQYDIARGNLSPRLSLGAGVYTNYADSRKEAVDPFNPDNSAMVTVPFQNQWSQNMAQSVFLSLQIPIFNTWQGMSKVKRARLEHSMALNTQQDEKQNLYRLISEDIQQVNALQKERDLLQSKKELLREAFAVSEKKLEQGLISVLEFYTAKNQLAQAEADWMRTNLQLKVKEQTIRFYMGEEYY